jgi:hypothetical protein
MGYYIETGTVKDKARIIAERYNGLIVPKPPSYEVVPEDTAIIVVLDNGPFKAAGFAYSKQEFEEFTDPNDGRRKTFVLIDKALAKKLTHFA